jgi:hypothetical protein
MGILYGVGLDTGLASRRTSLQGVFGDFGKQLIMLVVKGEDTELDDLRGNELEQFC